LALDEKDQHYLERAMQLAERARGCTSPNPLVGAVIVKGGRVLGEGYHVGPWRDHAEIAAMRDALRQSGGEQEHLRRSPGEQEQAAAQSAVVEQCRELCQGATLYVTLEPCCTYGRTPPCTSAVIGAGFSRVVVGAVDPSPSVNGRGLSQLRDAGIQVELAEGDLARRIKRQNDGMRKAVSLGLPFVTYKYAMSVDGRVATDSGDSRWISSEESRALVHRWRGWSDAVVVGAGTVAADDPTLTARTPGCQEQPLRVVLGDTPALSPESSLVRSREAGPVLVVCGPQVSAARRSELESWGIETAALAEGVGTRPEPAAAARLLAARGVQTVLLEGGPRVAGAWWGAGLVDKVAAFVCPKVVPGVANRGPLQTAGPATIAEGASLLEVTVEQVGPDVLVTGYVREPF
jgi:diaminohydroxyphosphoribosylaminopyrimidine deaminase/5-amino-6-(5-phosphoribosylamino)uracil reductase